MPQDSNRVAEEASFTADIKIAGVNPYVEVPEHIVEALRGGTKVSVLVKIDAGGKRRTSVPKREKLAKDSPRLKAIGRLTKRGWFRSTLVPRRSSSPWLYLDMWMREAVGVTVGDYVRITLKRDFGSRELAVPAAFREALDGNNQAKAAWDALSPSRQREILTYLNFLKTPAALERNVQKTVAILIAEDHCG
jgi:hypothetical protein